MKRRLLLLGLALSCLACYGEHSQTLSQEIPSNQTLRLTATDHILLSPGFKSDPKDGNEVRLEIDAYEVTAPESGLTGGPAYNDDGIVGALDGSVNVSTLGAATYTIPIAVPKGLGGMSPQLNIYYNNQQRNGLLGWNWDLSGISAITRTGGTFYHDGGTSAVDYVDDRFCLDGQRLCQVSSGDYGGHGVCYRTEQDQMSKIVSYSLSDINGPAYFKVWTADGKILTYGSSDDSRALVSTSHHVNIWLLKSIEDRQGNNITYHYLNNSDSYRLSRIDYSGNDNDDIDPVFSVNFNYDSREDTDLAYYGDCILRRDAILNSITITNQGQQMYLYQFDYQKPEPLSGYPYHRLSSIRLSADGLHLNPTKITWGDNNYDIPIINNTSINVSTTSNDNIAFANAVKFSGDFNGDGYTDVISVRPDLDGSYSTEAKLYVNKGLNGDLIFDYVRSFNLDERINWIYVADFNGDGRDDILLTYRQRLEPPIPDEVSFTIFVSRTDSYNDLSFTRHELPHYHIKNDLQEVLMIGDYFGEGRQSILIQALEDEKSQDETSVLIRYDDIVHEFQQTLFEEHLDANRFYAADYNGDGGTEILYKNHNGRTAIAQLSWDGDLPHFVPLHQGAPYHWEDCFPGDFNGDGITDVLFYCPNDPQPWSISLFGQKGIGSTNYHLPSSFPYESPGDYFFSLDFPNETDHFIKVIDLDGNGSSDLILKTGNITHAYLGPFKPNGDEAPFSCHRQIDAQAFHYFSNMDLCMGNFLGKDNIAFLGNYTLSHLPSMTPRYEVKQITDGMGRSVDFQYDYLMPNPRNPSEDDFYYLLSANTFPSYNIFSTYLPLRGLKKVTSYNVSGKPITVECHYEGALLHKRGKGFLGFTKTVQKDYCNGQLQKRTVRNFDLELMEQFIHPMMLQEQVYDKEGHLMAETWCNNRVYLNKDNHKVFVPISDKVISEYDLDNPTKLVKKEIHETDVATHYNNGFIYYYNTLSVTETRKGVTSNANLTQASSCEFMSASTTTYYANNTETWIINRPNTVTTRHHRSGNYTDICRQQHITYYPQSYLIMSVTELPNDGKYNEDPLTKRTDYQYDLTGNLIMATVSTPYGDEPTRRESYEYGRAYGRRLMTKRTDAAGHTTSYKYHPVYGHCISTTDCNKKETVYEQDPFGITKRTRHPNGTESCQALRWDDGGFYRWEKKTGQPTKITGFALTGETLRQQSYGINGETVTSSTEYDNYGRVIRESMPSMEGRPQQDITYEYDKHHRVKSIHHADGSSEVMSYEDNLSSVSFITTNGDQQTETKTFNVMGWVVKSTDANGVSVLYDYYPDGKTKWTQIEGMDETRIELAYDPLGNRFSLYDPDYGFTTDEYNAYGELTRRVTPDFITTEYEYDLLGNKTRRVETNKKSGQSSTTTWEYSTTEGTLGLLTEIKSDNQTISYQYDDQLRLECVSENCLDVSYKTIYTYDKASRLESMTYPSAYTIHYRYSSEGHLRDISDDNGQILWRLVETNAMGVPTRFITGNGFISDYDYDANNKLVSIQTQHDGQVIQDYSYGYDEFSNMTDRIDHRRDSHEHFGYDPLNRLVSATHGEHEDSFCYDPLGRMLSKTRDGQSVFSNADYSGPKPHAIKTAQTQPGIFPQERMDIEYTDFGKVSSITEGNNRVTFRYGHDHQRIQATEDIDGLLRDKIYVNSCEFITQPGTGTIIRTFLTGPTGVFAVVESKNGNTALHYIHKDHLGSWTVISDSQGKVEQEMAFDAWGNKDKDEEPLFDRGFTGHEHIRGLNLVNMNGRIYDPITSSMLNPDPFVQMPDFTQNFNRYAYCLNNPLTYVDPDGNSFIETAILCYLLFCTDLGYELQKEFLPVAFHLDLHLSTEQIGLGIDASVGIPKKIPLSVRLHGGLTYYYSQYDNSFQGWEFRTGAEICAANLLGVSGTTYYFDGKKQVTNTLYVGNSYWKLEYENDYMFGMTDEIFGFPHADNGDRYRTCAAKVRGLLVYAGVNLFTGDPGMDHADRRTYIDPANNRETYTIGANGEDPDAYRAGVLYVGVGPIKIGANSEQIRHILQNRFAHDFLCSKDSPYFKVLDRPGEFYFYFGSGTGNSLW